MLKQACFFHFSLFCIKIVFRRKGIKMVEDVDWHRTRFLAFNGTFPTCSIISTNNVTDNTLVLPELESMLSYQLTSQC